MTYPLSELIDRYSILLLKKERLDNAAVDNELNRFGDAIDEFGGSFSKTLDWVTKMTRINGLIWDLESDIRKGKEGVLGLEEVGRRALAIRDLNGERIAHKNLIAREMGEFEEIKVDHASQPAMV